MEQVLISSEIGHLEIKDGCPVNSSFFYNSTTIPDNHRIPNVLSYFLGKSIQWIHFQKYLRLAILKSTAALRINRHLIEMKLIGTMKIMHAMIYPSSFFFSLYQLKCPGI